MNKKYIYALIVLIFLFPLFSGSSSAQEYITDYAPVLYFEGEETCYPITVDYHIENSNLYEVGNSEPIEYQPDSSILSLYIDESNLDRYYLDNQKGSPDNPNGIINHYKEQESSLGYNVYYNIYSNEDTTVLQYWMFYAFNNGELNKHEGDWEMVQIVLENDNPVWVTYSQHHLGQWATWDQVEKENGHIKVFVARGSHANYLRSYSGVLGLSRDFVGSNGKVLEYDDYTLTPLESEDWIDFVGRWGECDGEDIVKFISSDALGRCGPPGPKFRESGNMWDSPIVWGQSVPQANDNLFLAEWFFYNFVLIYILIIAGILSVIGFFIYRRHKKFGLGPRKISLLYIDGLNLKSLGNILCIVGIILAIFGLFYSWYTVSYDLSSIGNLIGIQATGMQDLLSIDGINGVQVTIPGETGPMPLGTITFPFSLIIGIGILFLIISTIGIHHSKKLGGKYIWRGIRLIIPVIIILIVIMAIGNIIPTEVAGSDSTTTSTITNILSSISGSPFGSQQTFYISAEGISVPLPMQWGIGLGAILLLLSGIIIIVAGVLEFVANTQLFTPKFPIGENLPAMKKSNSKNTKTSKQGDVKQTFCTDCGKQLRENSDFCTECGKKINR
jgi:hypothetical protein